MTLDRWLDIATHGLTADAAARVRREYTDAFHDAHDAGEQNVVAGWGDPHHVNRELRRVHLTDREARALHPGYAPTLAGLGQALREDAAFVVGIWLWALVSDGTTSADRLGASLALLLMTLLRWLVVSRLIRQVSWRVAAQWLLQPLTVAVALIALTFVLKGRSGAAMPFPLIGDDRTVLSLLSSLLVLWVIASHLLRLPVSLRAAGKLEGESA